MIRQFLCNGKSVAQFHSFKTPSPLLELRSGMSPLEASGYSQLIMASSLIVVASALLSFVAAAPVPDRILSGSLEARQAPSCNIGTQVDNLTAYDSSCWNALDIMPYLTNWKATTPTCTDTENSAGQTLSCCGASEPWSTCFLRLATGQLNTYDCTQLSPTAGGPICSLSPDANGGRGFALAGLDPSIASQVNYVVLNIIMINNFFGSYYTGQSLLTSPM